MKTKILIEPLPTPKHVPTQYWHVVARECTFKGLMKGPEHARELAPPRPTYNDARIQYNWLVKGINIG